MQDWTNEVLLVRVQRCDKALSHSVYIVCGPTYIVVTCSLLLKILNRSSAF